jgi:hypothetical protein
MNVLLENQLRLHENIIETMLQTLTSPFVHAQMDIFNNDVQLEYCVWNASTRNVAVLI